MPTNEQKRSLLDLTRMFVYLPFNSIFDFVVYEEKQTLDFFDSYIYTPIVKGRVDYGWRVEQLLEDIRKELQ